MARAVFKYGIIIALILGNALVLSGCQTDNQEKGEKIMLHYVLPEEFENRYIGDVHPFYDEKASEWYLYYLATGGEFHSKLLTSKDGIRWKPTEIDIKSFLENYAVLGVLESNGKYYSYYGDYHASVSDDLLTWEYAGKSFQAFQDGEQFPGGCRDPFVAYDEVTDRYYSIAINYPKRVPNEGISISNLAIGRTGSSSLEDWSGEAKQVFGETRDNHDPECPQLVKIGNRWYVFTSFYGYSSHGVGGLSYLIGDENVDPYSVDWTGKEIHTLAGEDLCAAQVAPKGDQFYLFGWIPKEYNGNFWGGHVNLPVEIYPMEGGKLGARLPKEMSEQIRGKKYFESDKAISVTEEKSYPFTMKKRSDTELSFEMMGNYFELDFKDKNVSIEIIKKQERSVAQASFDRQILSEVEIDPADLQNVTMRILSEADMMEIYINDKYYLPVRIGVSLDNEEVTVKSENVSLNHIAAYQLKTREGLNQEGAK